MTIGNTELGDHILVTGTGAPQVVLPRDGAYMRHIANTSGATISAWDSATVAGISSANQILNAMPMTQANLVSLNIALNSGLVVTLTAAAIVLFVVQ